MRRTTVGLIVLLALGLFLAPYPSQAQSVAKTPRIGILTPAFDSHPASRPSARVYATSAMSRATILSWSTALRTASLSDFPS